MHSDASSAVHIGEPSRVDLRVAAMGMLGELSSASLLPVSAGLCYLLIDVSSVEGIYLHVEAANAGALSLYRGAGYSAVPPTPLLTTFTRALHLTHADPILMFKRVPCDGAAR